MFRSTSSVLALLVAMTMPAAAADYGDWEENDDAPDFRTTYPIEPGDWAGLGDDDDPLSLEFGVRYWYSMGRQSFTTLSGDFTSQDTAHTGELHLRIDDQSTNTFAKAIAGYSAAIMGDYDDPSATGTINAGHIGYVGGDIGYHAFGDKKAGIGPMVGYLFWNDSPYTQREAYTTATSPIPFDTITGDTFLPFDSTDNNLDIHALRLGVQGHVELAEMFDLDGEVVAVPYAKVNGVLGGHATTTTTTGLGNIASVKSSSTEVDGWGYGAMAQAMVGFHPTENFTFRLGGRAWYLQGTTDMTYSQLTTGDPTDSDPGTNPPNYDTAPPYSNQRFIEKGNPFSLFRYGLVAEVTYRF
jgi:hypothetical protein